jgi:hypothetical protein
MNLRLFVSACILAAGLLIKFGAPLPAVVAGIGLAVLWNWRARRLTASWTRSKH